MRLSHKVYPIVEVVVTRFIVLIASRFFACPVRKQIESVYTTVFRYKITLAVRFS